MAAVGSPSFPSPNEDDHTQIPTATLALPSASRRLPPPCWSAEETVTLIDAYRDKWYSLNRGNLRANHWQEVADDLASRCSAIPPKTAVQCRHKMEKLRKRYRTEIQRAAAHGGVRRYSSSWANFQNMHSMETGTTSNPTPPSSSEDDEEEDRKDSIKRISDLYSYSNSQKGIFGNQLPIMDNGTAPVVRNKIPGGITDYHHPQAMVFDKFDYIGGQIPNIPNPRFPNSIASSYGGGRGKFLREDFRERDKMGVKKASDISKKKKLDTVMGDVVTAIQALGEDLMRVEKAKMDMAQQVEEMRMEMELKRTRMLLESQQRILGTFAKAISESSSKKAKRIVMATDDRH